MAALELADREHSRAIQLAELAKDSKFSVVNMGLGCGYSHERAKITTTLTKMT